MAQLDTLTTLIKRVRSEADLLNSTYVSDADITDLINIYSSELYDGIVQSGPSDYFLSSTVITTIANTTTYTLPSDFRSLVRVMVTDNIQRLRPVMPLQESAQAVYATPQGAYPVTVEYVPTPPVLVNPTDTLDGVSGWSQLTVLLCAQALLRRQRRDTTPWDGKINEYRSRIAMHAPKRNQAGPLYVHDTDEEGDYPFYGVAPSVDAWRLTGTSGVATLELWSISPIWP